MITYASIDTEKIQNLVAEIQENIRELEQLSSVSYEKFCEYFLQYVREKR